MKKFLICAALVFTSTPAFAAGTRHVCSFVSRPGTTAGAFASVSCAVSTNVGGYPWSGTELPAPWLAAGTAKNLSITSDVAPGVGNSRTVTFRRSSADTALTVTLSGTNTTATNATDLLTLSVGDLVDLKYSTSGTPSGTNISVSWTFDSTSVGESAYISSPQASHPATFATTFTPPFNNSNDAWNFGQLISPIPISGNMTRYDVILTIAPGAGTTWTFAWVKNGVTQDGTAGSVDTRLSVANTATTGSWTGTLSLSPGDTVSLGITPAVGSPSNSGFFIIGSKFVATTNGQSFICGSDGGSPSTSVVNYQQIMDQSSNGTFPWDATESNRQAAFGQNAVTLGNFYFVLGTAPGTGKSYTFDLRKNGSNAGPSVLISDTNKTGNDTTHTVSLSPGDLINIQSTPSGTPASNTAPLNWCLAETAIAITSSFPALTVAP